MSDKNCPPSTSQTQESFSEIDWLSLWQASGNDWKWMLKTHPIKDLAPNENVRHPPSTRKLMRVEVFLTVAFLVIALALI